jgi:hypothetical protein
VRDGARLRILNSGETVELHRGVYLDVLKVTPDEYLIRLPNGEIGEVPAADLALFILGAKQVSNRCAPNYGGAIVGPTGETTPYISCSQSANGVTLDTSEGSRFIPASQVSVVVIGGPSSFIRAGIRGSRQPLRGFAAFSMSTLHAQRTTWVNYRPNLGKGGQFAARHGFTGPAASRSFTRPGDGSGLRSPRAAGLSQRTFARPGQNPAWGSSRTAGLSQRTFTRPGAGPASGAPRLSGLTQHSFARANQENSGRLGGRFVNRTSAMLPVQQQQRLAAASARSRIAQSPYALTGPQRFPTIQRPSPVGVAQGRTSTSQAGGFRQTRISPGLSSGQQVYRARTIQPQSTSRTGIRAPQRQVSRSDRSDPRQ